MPPGIAKPSLKISNMSPHQLDQGFVVRASLPITYIQTELSSFLFSLFTGGIVVLFIAGFVSWLTSRKLTHPLEQLEAHARDIAAGHFDAQIEEFEIKRI